MATKAHREERAAGDPLWLEIRDQEGGFGSVIRETKVSAAATAPSPEAYQVPDGTPEHDWEPWPAALIPGISRLDQTAQSTLLGYPGFGEPASTGE